MIADLRFALRQFIKAPGYTLGLIFILALGIGATTVTFSLVDAVMFRAVPVDHPERLIDLDEYNNSHPYVPSTTVSYIDFLDWRREQKSLAHIAIYRELNFTADGDGGAEALKAGEVSTGFFEALGTVPTLGRAFLQEEESLGGPQAVVLSEALWRRRFHADPDVLHQTLRLDGVPYQIVGVAPAQFRFPNDEDVWVPIRRSTAETERGNRSYSGVARLKDGVSVAQATTDLTRLQDHMAEINLSDAKMAIKVRPFSLAMTQSYRAVVLTLFGAVLCLLAITCVNLASLGLARGSFRSREMAVRAALGASRGRIVRQLLVENLALGLVGGTAGVLLAQWGVTGLQRLLADQVPYWMVFSLSGPVLGFAALLAVGSSVASGLVPALQLARTDVRAAMSSGGRGGSGEAPRLLRWLLVAEVAMAVVLLSGAGILLKSFLHLAAASPGFRPQGVMTFTIALPAASYPSPGEQQRAKEEIVARLRHIPGVTDAAMTSNLPLTGNTWGRSVVLGDRPVPKPGEVMIALNRVATPDYFRVMGIPLKAGRGFTEMDTETSARVVLVDEEFVRACFPDKNPIGQRMHYGRDPTKNPWMEIVGVVGAVHQTQLSDVSGDAGIYVPIRQEVFPYDATFVMHTDGAPESLMEPARRVVAEFDHGLAIQNTLTMEQWVRAAMWRDRLVSEISLGFAAMALILTAMGVYAVTSFVTAQRTRELGIRLALGASPGDVSRLILGGGLRLALISLPLGLVTMLGVAQVIASLLYDVNPRDPAVLGSVALLLAAVTLGASWIPARRAMRLDPLIALKNE